MSFRSLIPALVAFGGALIPIAAYADVVTYNYTGSHFVACGPTSGSCPPNYQTDYIIASVSFNEPLAANLTVTNDFTSISAWSISDLLNYFSFSSLDSNGATELEGIQTETDLTGSIVGYYMLVSSAYRPSLGYNTVTIQSNNLPQNDYMDLSHGIFGEWAASSAQNGVWIAGIVATPEPSTATLGSLSVGILIVALGSSYLTRRMG